MVSLCYQRWNILPLLSPDTQHLAPNGDTKIYTKNQIAKSPSVPIGDKVSCNRWIGTRSV